MFFIVLLSKSAILYLHFVKLLTWFSRKATATKNNYVNIIKLLDKERSVQDGEQKDNYIISLLRCMAVKNVYTAFNTLFTNSTLL